MNTTLYILKYFSMLLALAIHIKDPIHQEPHLHQEVHISYTEVCIGQYSDLSATRSEKLGHHSTFYTE